MPGWGFLAVILLRKPAPLTCSPKSNSSSRASLIYGLGDVATTIISFFLLPIYVRYLSPDDYGVLSLLLTTEW